MPSPIAGVLLITFFYYYYYYHYHYYYYRHYYRYALYVSLRFFITIIVVVIVVSTIGRGSRSERSLCSPTRQFFFFFHRKFPLVTEETQSVVVLYIVYARSQGAYADY